MTGILNLLAGAVGVVKDTYFNLVTLLLPGNGTNGAQNNTFLDSSSNNFTITRNGNTTQGTFSPFSQTGWSNYFDGGANRLTTATSSQFNLTGANITLECWVYVLAAPSASNRLITIGPNNAQSSLQFSIETNMSFSVGVPFSSGGGVGSSANSIPFNAWTHLAFVLSGTTGTIYVNGVQVGQSTGWNITSTTSNYFYIGYDSTATVDGKLTGYISNVRLIVGTALYTSSFTPPKSPLTAVANTKILTCQSNNFTDNSSNAFAITVNGTPSVQSFSPFAPTAAYSAATNGGSGYFDGSGDFLTAADNTAFQFGTGTLTVEFWYFPVASLTNAGLVDMRASGSSSAGLFIRQGDGSSSGTQITCWAGNPGTTAATQTGLNINQWNHVAVVRDGSNNLQVFVNGSGGTAVARSINLSDQSLRIAAFVDASASPNAANGYISNLRIVKGTAVYTGAFSPPIAPLSTSGSASSSAYSSTTNVNTTFAASNTSLLLNFTNAGITDATAKNDLETVGNAQISTTQSKFGGSSMYFDGTGDYLTAYNNSLFKFGTGDFTVEFWIYVTSIGTYNNIFHTGDNSTGQLNVRLNSGKVELFANDSAAFSLIGATTLSTNTWYHIAISRSGSSNKIFVNGTQDATGTNSYSYSGTGLIQIAAWSANNPSYQFAGYIDDLRITRGYARYTANFTPPTAAFPVQ